MMIGNFWFKLDNYVAFTKTRYYYCGSTKHFPPVCQAALPSLLAQDEYHVLVNTTYFLHLASGASFP